MNVVDLFCGLRGWSSPWRNRVGNNVWTTDIDPSFSPTRVADILDLKASDIPQPVDILFASPPCESFSVASIGTHWTGGRRVYEPRTDAARKGVALVEKTMELIQELQPRYAVIENPRGVLRKLGLIPVEPVTIWYCHYEETRAKPTDLWGLPFPEKWYPRPECHNRRPGHVAECCCQDHVAAPRGAKTGTQGIRTYAQRSKIPYELAWSFYAVLVPEHA